MSKRLQVLLEPEELRAVQQAARRKRLTTAEWVRQSLRAAVEEERGPAAAAKLEALSIAMRYAFPAPDIEDMLAEIEAGYGDARDAGHE